MFARIAARTAKFAAAGRQGGRAVHRATRSMHSSMRKAPVYTRWGAPIMAGAVAVGFLGPMTWAEPKPEATANKADEVVGETDSEGKPKRRREEYKYIIVGGGPAAYGALQGIRKLDKEGSVLIIADEYFPPYARAALSKELFQEGSDPFVLSYQDKDNKKQSIFYLKSEAYEKPTTLYTGLSLDALDLEARLMRVSDGSIFKYEKLLLATGCRPQTLKIPVDDGVDEMITPFYKIDDFRRMYHTSGDVMVYGGGFLGAELACALSRKKDRKVTLVCDEDRVLDSRLPKFLSELITEKLRGAGVDVITSAEISAVANANANDEKKPPQPLVVLKDVNTSSLAEVKTGHIVMVSGSRPNTEIGSVAGLEVDEKNGGLMVNPDLQARGHVWVAGDLASYYDMISETRVRSEGYDHAIHSGFVAGENMGADGYYTGQAKHYREMKKPITANEALEISPELPLMMPYRHIPFFWSDMGTVGVAVESVGRMDSGLKTVAFYTPDKESEAPAKGVVFYMMGKKVVGVTMWNVEDQIDTARIVIKLNRKYESTDALKQLPLIVEALGTSPKCVSDAFNDQTPQ